MRPVIERFWERVKRSDDPNECWLWQGAIDKRTGYPRFKDGFTTYAHRWIYREFVGEIPAGLELDHTCNVRRCVNPRHLESVTHAENQRRRTLRAVACPNGHPYDESNSKIKDGQHRCRICEKLNQRRFQTRIANGHQTPQLTRQFCKRRHLLDEENTYVNKSGYKHCRVCSTLNKRGWRHRTGKR